MKITTVGLDIAKRVFQLHGVDAAGKAVLRRIRRGLNGDLHLSKVLHLLLQAGELVL